MWLPPYDSDSNHAISIYCVKSIVFLTAGTELTTVFIVGLFSWIKLVLPVSQTVINRKTKARYGGDTHSSSNGSLETTFGWWKCLGLTSWCNQLPQRGLWWKRCGPLPAVIGCWHIRLYTRILNLFKIHKLACGRDSNVNSQVSGWERSNDNPGKVVRGLWNSNHLCISKTEVDEKKCVMTHNCSLKCIIWNSYAQVTVVT